MLQVIPKPLSVQLTGKVFALTSATNLVVSPDTPALRTIAEQLAALLRPATGFTLPIASAPSAINNAITLRLDPAAVTGAAANPEGYRLSITPSRVEIVAGTPAGIFYGLQTLRQMLPPSIEQPVGNKHPGATGPWTLPTGEIVDAPRFGWRGMMLDVARHFFTVADVKRLIDLLALYKINRLHLHLADDQGWRLEIRSWPKLTEIGGSTSVNGDGGGFYTQEEYAGLVAYAADRFITIVPEIDLPGHTNAALASYPELNCDGQPRSLFTGIQVGFSSLCVDKEITYQFVGDVLGELAQLTPGPYLHIGGDEAMATSPDEYRRFMERVQPIVQRLDKQVIGWEELGQVQLLPGTLVQHWNTDPSRSKHTLEAIDRGAKVIMSPAERVYIDMKYNPDTPLGLDWAAQIEVQAAYDWDPAEHTAGVEEEHIVGVEAPLWSETLRTLDEVEYMTFPRLPGVAEIGWSPADGRTWDEYRTRLAAQAERWAALGVDYYRSPQVPWP